MDISAVHIHLADNLPVKLYSETKHSVRCRVLGTDIHHIFTLFEEHVFGLFHLSATTGFISRSHIDGLFALQPYRINLLVGIVIFPQRISHPIIAQKQPAHVGVIDESNTEKVEHLAFIQIGCGPNIHNAGQFGVLPIQSRRP